LYYSEQHEKVLNSYNEKWNKYREVYEERPLAQVTRKMKLEAASLDIEGSFYSFDFNKVILVKCSFDFFRIT